MRTSIALLVLIAGCATPNKYYPDAGDLPADAAGMDGARMVDDAATPDRVIEMDSGPDAPADASLRDVPVDEALQDAAVDERLSPDLSLPADQPPVACTRCTNGSCAGMLWDFDSGSLQGAKSGGVFAASPAIAMAPAYQGSQSLAMSIPVEFTGAGNSAYASFPICGGTSSANLRTRTFKARVYLENGSQPATMPFNLQLYTEDMTEAIVNTFHAPGSWVLLEGQLPAVEDANVTELQLWFGSAMNPSWRGTVWVDDVRID
jgi:hypothetical protein